MDNMDDNSPALDLDPDQDGDNDVMNPDESGETEAAPPDTSNETASYNAADTQPGAVMGRLAQMQQLVKAASLHGWHSIGMQSSDPLAQLGAYGMEGQGYAGGGLVKGYEDGGDTGDDQSNFVQYLDTAGGGGDNEQEPIPPPMSDDTTPPVTQAPESNEEQQLDTRQNFLNTFGAGTQRQNQAIQQQRAAIPEGQGEQDEAKAQERLNDQRNSLLGRASNAVVDMAQGQGNTPLVPGAFGQTFKKFLDYLHPVDPDGSPHVSDFLKGAYGMPPQTVQAIEYAVDPKGEMDPVERKAKMIEYAKDKGGMGAAAAALQKMRVDYNLSRAFAASKLQDGDIGAAIQGANKAFEAPFGESIHFSGDTPGQVKAIIVSDGKLTSYTMDQSHFQHLLTGVGEFDNFIHDGVKNTIASLATPDFSAYQKPPSDNVQGPSQPPAEKAPTTPPAATPTPQAAPSGDLNASRLLHTFTPQEIAAEQNRKGPRMPEGLMELGISPALYWYGHSQGWNSKDFVDLALKARQGDNSMIAAQKAYQLQGLRGNQAEQRQQERLGSQADLLNTRENFANARQQTTEQGKNTRFDAATVNKFNAALAKLQAAGRTDRNASNRAAILKDAIANNQGDFQGMKNYLKERGIDYDKEIENQGTAPQPLSTLQGPMTTSTPATSQIRQNAPQAQQQAPQYRIINTPQGLRRVPVNQQQ